MNSPTNLECRKIQTLMTKYSVPSLNSKLKKKKIFAFKRREEIMEQLQSTTVLAAMKLKHNFEMGSKFNLTGSAILCV